tara:strand:+ start:1238 stop:2035 length:798 start_codon:yes stop_codon:yes gene_type:complete
MAALTTIAAGVAIAGTATSTAMSFSEANKSKKAMREAEAEAESKMKEARARLDVNFADALSINKEPYERQREAMLAAGAQALEAGVESERGGAATAGRVLAAQQNAQGDIRDEMNRDLYDLEAAKAEEASRLRDINLSLDLGQLEGAQMKAAEMENRANMQRQQGIEGALSVVEQGAAMPALYAKNTGAQRDALSKSSGFSTDEYNTFGKVKGNSMVNGDMDFDAVGRMSNMEFRSFKRKLTPQQKRMLFMSREYTDNYKDPFAL